MGFQIFESILVENGRCFLWDLHKERLACSADVFSYSFDLRTLEKKRDDLLEGCATGTFKLRLFLDRDGRISGDIAPPVPIRTNHVVLSEAGVDSKLPLLGHKTTAQKYLYPEAAERLKGENLADVLFWNEKGQVTEGSRANIFYQAEGKLFTPPAHCGLLPGTFRGHLLAKGLVEERILRVIDLPIVEALYLGNSVRRLFPVRLFKAVI
jgi:para-aminobenzoate synthetase/4-amino-4-deoxychorismate lyase